MLLHRLLPFGVVLVALIASTIIALVASAALETAGIGGTLAAILIAYLTGSAPKSQ